MGLKNLLDEIESDVAEFENGSFQREIKKQRLVTEADKRFMSFVFGDKNPVSGENLEKRDLNDWDAGSRKQYQDFAYQNLDDGTPENIDFDSLVNRDFWIARNGEVVDLRLVPIKEVALLWQATRVDKSIARLEGGMRNNWSRVSKAIERELDNRWAENLRGFEIVINDTEKEAA